MARPANWTWSRWSSAKPHGGDGACSWAWKARSGEIAGGSVQRPAAGGGGGVDHPDGAAGVGEGELALAVRAQRAGGVAGSVDFEAKHDASYNVSDALMAHREAVEKHLFEQVTEPFGLGHTVTLYVVFRRRGGDQTKAQRGHSKDRKCAADPWGWCGRFGYSCAAPKSLPAGSTKTRRWSRCSRPARARRRPGGDGRRTTCRDNGYRYRGQPPTNPPFRPRAVHRHRDPVAPQGSPAQGGG